MLQMTGACIVPKKRTQMRKTNDAKENCYLKSYGKIKTERQQNHAGKMLSRKIKLQNVRTHFHSYTFAITVSEGALALLLFSYTHESHSFSNKFTSISIFRSGFSEWVRWRCRRIENRRNVVFVCVFVLCSQFFFSFTPQTRFYQQWLFVLVSYYARFTKYICVTFSIIIFINTLFFGIWASWKKETATR